jgi:ribosome maturation factor RimP
LMSLENNLDEPRLVTESGLAARLAKLAEPVAQSLGYRMVRVRLAGPVLQIMAERADGSFSIEDCEKLSRALSPVLDAEDVMSKSYQLEVSSPGIDRPLARAADFTRNVGNEIKIEFTQMIGNRKRGRATIASVNDGGIELKFDDAAENLNVPYNAISDAKLVLNDKLLFEAQKRAKQTLSDGADFDPAQYDDITMSEDRRTSHGR